MVSEFKHITVSAEPDEDVVIYAGLPAAEPRDGAETRDIAADEREEGGGDALREPDAAEPRSAEASEAASPAEPRSAEAREAASPVEPRSAEAGEAASPAPDDLTLEDLKAPMPLKQRIIIVAAVICLIGAIVYYLAFMR